MGTFMSAVRDGLHLITCPSVVEIADEKIMEDLIKQWLARSESVHVLDFTLVTNVRSGSYRPFLTFQQKLKENGKTLCCLGMTERILPFIRQEGLEDIFVRVESLEEARQFIEPIRTTIDLVLINTFILATRDVLEEEMKIQLQPGKTYLRKAMETIAFDLACAVAFTSAKFKGSISLCFRKETFLKMYESMTGEVHETITPALEDSAMDLLNLIFEKARSIFEDQHGQSLGTAFPSVLVGAALKLHHPVQQPAIILPFQGPHGTFHLEIAAVNN